MPEKGMRVPFFSRLKPSGRPNVPVLCLRERNAQGFTVAWREPRARNATGDGQTDTITHYELQISTTAPNGTHYPWQALWMGAGHETPDFRLVVAERTGDTATAERVRQSLEQEALAFGNDADADPNLVSEQLDEATTLQTRLPVYSLFQPVDPALFGFLRIRCWAAGDERPSRFSKPVLLPRHKGSADLDIKLKMVNDIRSKYFRRLTQHVTSGHPVDHRIGNPPSPNQWGVHSQPARQKSQIAKELKAAAAMAPVPYDVPRLPKDLPGVDEAGSALARFYLENGARGGGGEWLGLRIDHIIHAMVGTPLKDGQSSPRRTEAGLKEPLLALCEVAYADVLLSLFDSAVVLQTVWQQIDEKVFG